jgi:peptidoglycan hydrolase CwlO-like protein
LYVAEYKKIKDKIKELEEKHAAISTSYTLLCEDTKEVEAKNKNLESRVKDLETQVEEERSKGLEYARRGLSLKAENDQLKICYHR